MSKVENSYEPGLKTILKHHFNVNRTQMNKYSCTQILISIRMDRFAYMQNLCICKLKFALSLNQMQISRICIWCKFCIRVQIHSHGQICTREYICIYANICTHMQIFAHICKSVHVNAPLVLTNSAISTDCSISLNLLETHPSVCKSFRL